MSVELVHKLIHSNKQAVIAIDGELGSGKTTLARKLAMLHGIRCIHLDDFLEKGRRTFIDALQFDVLHAALSKEHPPFIIEGICLLSVLKRLGVQPDIHIFLLRNDHLGYYKKSSKLVLEVENYIADTDAKNQAVLRLNIMPFNQTNQLDVDIAYLKAKTIVSSCLALGGIVAIIVGAFVLNAGIQSENSTVIKMLGAEVTAKGIGGVILSSSVLWAYFSYLCRPKYSRRKESRSNIGADGAQEIYEFESATMAAAEPSESKNDT